MEKDEDLEGKEKREQGGEEQAQEKEQEKVQEKEQEEEREWEKEKEQEEREQEGKEQEEGGQEEKEWDEKETEVITRDETLPTVSEPEKKKKKGLLGVWGAILLVLAKMKSLVILLKLGKFGSTLISMLIMVWVYAKLYGAAYGIGFVLLLMIHEMGHYLCAKLLKLNVSLPLFIPFAGAFINMKEMPPNAEAEAKVGLGGPVLGSLGAFLCMLLYYPIRHDFLLALAYTGFMLNLFNLIPIKPLDGGRAVSAISPWLWVIGLPIAVIFLFKYPNPILVILLILGVIEVVDQVRNPKKEYFKVKPAHRVIFALVYFGLITALGLGMAYIHGIHVNMFVQ